MKILVAPNSFKGGPKAKEVGGAIVRGLQESQLQAEYVNLPIADGGDGSLEILAEVLGAQLERMNVTGPHGLAVEASFGINENEGMGVVELAEASGIRLVDPGKLEPRIASTYGTGEILKHLISKGIHQIYLTVGGSATIDGGVGILMALGLQLWNGESPVIVRSILDVANVDRLGSGDLTPIKENLKVILLTDVNNQLLGDEGAVMVFGRQKGVAPDHLHIYEDAMVHWAGLLKQHTGVDVSGVEGAGASGGVPAGLTALLNTAILSGAEEILKLTGFHEQLATADLLITAEGQIDGQTTFGKGPGLAASYARAKGISVIGICGQIGEDYVTRDSVFTAVFSINSRITSLEEAMRGSEKNLVFTAHQLGNLLAQTS